MNRSSRATPPRRAVRPFASEADSSGRVNERNQRLLDERIIRRDHPYLLHARPRVQPILVAAKVATAPARAAQIINSHPGSPTTTADPRVHLWFPDRRLSPDSELGLQGTGLPCKASPAPSRSASSDAAALQDNHDLEMDGGDRGAPAAVELPHPAISTPALTTRPTAP